LRAANSGQTRKRALSILSKDTLSSIDVRELSDLIQEDIDADFAEIPGLNEESAQDQEYLNLVAAHEAEIQKIEQEMKAVGETAGAQAIELADLAGAVQEFERQGNIRDVQDRLAGN